MWNLMARKACNWLCPDHFPPLFSKNLGFFYKAKSYFLSWVPLTFCQFRDKLPARVLRVDSWADCVFPPGITDTKSYREWHKYSGFLLTLYYNSLASFKSLLSTCRCRNEILSSKIAHSVVQPYFSSAKLFGNFIAWTHDLLILGHLLENHFHIIFTWRLRKDKISIRTLWVPNSSSGLIDMKRSGHSHLHLLVPEHERLALG